MGIILVISNSGFEFSRKKSEEFVKFIRKKGGVVKKIGAWYIICSLIFCMQINLCAMKNLKKVKQIKNLEEKFESQKYLNKCLMQECVKSSICLGKIKKLVRNGADINYKSKKLDEKFAPLHYATFKGSLSAVMYFVKSGADINALGSNFFYQNKVPAFFAAIKDYYDIVKYLVDQGSDADIYFFEVNRVNFNHFNRPINYPRLTYNTDDIVKEIIDKSEKRKEILELSLDLFKKKRFTSKTAKKIALHNIYSFLVLKDKSSPYLDRIALDGLAEIYKDNKSLFCIHDICKLYKNISFSNLQFFNHKNAVHFVAFSDKKIIDYNGNTIKSAILKNKNALLLFPEYIFIILLSNWDIFAKNNNLKRLLAPKYFGEKFKIKKDSKELKYLLDVRELAVERKSRKFLYNLLNSVMLLITLNNKLSEGLGAEVFKFMCDDLLCISNETRNSKKCVIL